MPIVKFKGGKTFQLDENKISEYNKDDEKIDIMVVNKINFDDLYMARDQGFKIFECSESENICLSKIYNLLYSKKKSCKFA